MAPTTVTHGGHPNPNRAKDYVNDVERWTGHAGGVTVAPSSAVRHGGSYSEYRNGVPTHYAVHFTPTDGGRSTSTRPRSKNDCTVRAVALACGVPFDKAYDVLSLAGREPHRGFHFSFWAHSDAPLHALGVQLTWRPFQAVKGESRMNMAKFCTLFPRGRWICRTAKHVLAVVDGVVMDTHDPPPGRCVYGAWEVVEVSHAA